MNDVETCSVRNINDVSGVKGLAFPFEGLNYGNSVFVEFGMRLVIGGHSPYHLRNAFDRTDQSCSICGENRKTDPVFNSVVVGPKTLGSDLSAGSIKSPREERSHEDLIKMK